MLYNTSTLSKVSIIESYFYIFVAVVVNTRKVKASKDLELFGFDCMSLKGILNHPREKEKKKSKKFPHHPKLF